MKILSKIFVEGSNDFAKYQHAIGWLLSLILTSLIKKLQNMFFKISTASKKTWSVGGSILIEAIHLI